MAADEASDGGFYASQPPLLPTFIRLLQLLPGDMTDSLHGTMFNYPIQQSSSAPYEAFSYTWGTDGKPNAICIDNRAVNITQNLHTALLHLRYRFLPRLLWVDALCINQDNDEEKNIQIPLMPQIYAKALRTIVWLGESTDGSDQALNMIRRAAHDSDRTEGAQPEIQNLLRRPWFERIWVGGVTSPNVHNCLKAES